MTLYIFFLFSQVTVNQIRESTGNFLASILDALRFRILQVAATEQVRSSVEKVFKEITSPFERINIKPLLNSFVKRKFNYVNYEVRDLGNFLVCKKVKNKIRLCEKKEGVHLHTKNRKFTATFNKC